MATFDATPSGTAANAYMTVEEADDLIGAWPTAIQGAWDGLKKDDAEPAQDEQEQLLMEAAQLVDQYTDWGPRRVASQALSFPRATDKAGEVPPEVKRACLWYAAMVLEGDRTQIASLKRLQAEGVTSFGVLGQSQSLAEDPSGLPAGARRELDRLRRSHFPQMAPARTRAPLPGQDADGFFFGAGG